MLEVVRARAVASRWHLAPLAISGTALILVTLARPSLVADTRIIVLLPGLLLMALVLCHYQQTIPAAVALVFLWAGTPLWGSDGMQIARWWILGMAALVGALIWITGKVALHFSAIHFFAAFVALAAFTTVFQSVNPWMTLLKATS